MKPDLQRFHRMKRIERIRAIASRTAASEAAAAEGTLAQLLALRDRTAGIHAGYDPGSASDAAQLEQMVQFQSGLSRIVTQTDGDIASARAAADSKQEHRRQAEQKRAMAEDRVDAMRKALAREGECQPVPGRKPIWHDT